MSFAAHCILAVLAAAALLAVALRGMFAIDEERSKDPRTRRRARFWMLAAVAVALLLACLQECGPTGP